MCRMIPWFDASLVTLAGHTLPTQGPLAVAGLAVGHVVFARHLRRTAPTTALRADLVGFGSLIAAVLAGHAVAVWMAGTALDPWHPALAQSSVGAAAGGLLAVLGLGRCLRLPPRLVTDAAAIAFAHGWPLVRLGCALAHDHPGRHSTAALAVAFPGGPRLDIGLCEWLASLFLLALARVSLRSALPVGVLAARLLAAGGLARFLLEWLRVDDPGQLVELPGALALMAAAAAVLAGVALAFFPARQP